MRKNVNRARGVAEAQAHDAILRRYRAAVQRSSRRSPRRVQHDPRFRCGRPRAGERAARDMHAVGADLAHFALLSPFPA
jgi:hypothetical protein